MRIAASIFLLAGLAYLGWDIALALSGGASLGNVVVALVAAALLYQGYTLFLFKPGARVSGMVMSSIIAIASALIAGIGVAFGLSVETWPALGAVVLISVAFGAAAVLLMLAKRAAP
jgi:hypothetical protein